MNKDGEKVALEKVHWLKIGSYYISWNIGNIIKTYFYFRSRASKFLSFSLKNRLQKCVRKFYIAQQGIWDFVVFFIDILHWKMEFFQICFLHLLFKLIFYIFLQFFVKGNLSISFCDGNLWLWISIILWHKSAIQNETFKFIFY